MPPTDIAITVTADRLAVKLSLIGRPAEGETVELDSGALEDLIRDLSDARASLSDKVPEVLEPHPVLGAVEKETRFWVFEDHDAEPHRKVLLTLRHSGLGWLPFLISNDEAKRLAWLLTKQSMINVWRAGTGGWRRRHAGKR